jgi:hypothetical protein
MIIDQIFIKTITAVLLPLKFFGAREKYFFKARNITIQRGK